MGRVGRALVLHELLERARDRWVLVITILFAALASAVSVYGGRAGGDAAVLTGPSLVTLASLFVPLVALVLSHDAIVGERERNTLQLLLAMPIGRVELVVAKLLGRALALSVAVVAGLGIATLLQPAGQREVMLALMAPTLLLGLAFLSLGILISTITSRQVMAASLVVVTWFCLVFFYDLALLGVLVATEGALPPQLVTNLVVGNPAGLYRVQLMQELAGSVMIEALGQSAALPGRWATAAIWAGWIIVPTGLSGVLLRFRRSLR